VLNVCGWQAAGNEVASVARLAGWTAAAAAAAAARLYTYARSLVPSELSWWGVKSSLHVHVAPMHTAVTTALDHYVTFTGGDSLWCLIIIIKIMPTILPDALAARSNKHLTYHKAQLHATSCRSGLFKLLLYCLYFPV
jgi:hypothetical protein